MRHRFNVHVNDITRYVAREMFPANSYPSVRYVVSPARSDGAYVIELTCEYEGILNEAARVVRVALQRRAAYKNEQRFPS